MFELETATKAKQTDLEVLSQKNRPADSNPGVVLSFMAERPNSALSELSGHLRSAMYCKNANAEASPQRGLEGVEPISDLPNLTDMGEHIGRFTWAYKQTGCTLTYDYGAGGASNIVLKDVTVEALHVTCKEGGTTTWQWKCEINDVDVAVFGKLATFKNREVSILLHGPTVEQGDIDDAPAPPVRAAKVKKAQATGSGEPEGAWPFPNTPPAGAKTPEQAFVDTARD